MGRHTVLCPHTIHNPVNANIIQCWFIHEDDQAYNMLFITVLCHYNAKAK